MIEDKTVYEWAKQERDSIKDYLSRDWNYAHDVDFENDDDGLLYRKHCEGLDKQYEFLSNVLEWLQDEISFYEQMEADAKTNSECFF